MTDAFPLQWPIGRTRTPSYQRKNDPFKMPSGKIRSDLYRELKLMKVANFVINSDMQVRNDGLPYAKQRTPDDPGVVLYFTRKGQDIAISCDQYRLIDANLRAIGKTIEAIRGMERWGTEEMVDRAFTGFAALPESIIMGAGQARAWYEVLQVSQDADPEIIRAAWKRLVARYHPDNQETGDPVKFEEVQQAFKEATS